MFRQRSVAEIAEHLAGTVMGDGDRVISGVSTPGDAGPSDLAFVESPRHLTAASGAGAILIGPALVVPESATAIRVAEPAVAMARAIEWLIPVHREFEGVSPAAVVDRTAMLGTDVGIGPFVSIGADVRIGDRTEVHPSTTIARGCTIGADCLIYAGVHLYPETSIGDRVILHSGVVIGADGFGYVPESMPPGTGGAEEPRRHRKIRQIGRVIVGDDVEIGANTTIDRASLSATRIGRGSKIDNLVQIGHNARVGRHCIIIGQAGISGSTVLEDYVTVAGQAGLAGHVHVGRGVVIGAQSGVTKDLQPGEIVLGSPAVESRRAKKALALIDSLPDFKRTLARHEQRLAEIARRLDDQADA